LVSTDATFYEDQSFYPSSVSVAASPSLLDPTPISFPSLDAPLPLCSQGGEFLASLPINSLSTDSIRVDSSSSSPISPNSFSQPETAAEPHVPTPYSAAKHPLQVYSRRPKAHPEEQQNQSSLPDVGLPENNTEDESTSNDNLDWAMPIALRKGVRSCVKYPMSNHLTYAKLSPQYKGFIASIDSIVVPRNIHRQ